MFHDFVLHASLRIRLIVNYAHVRLALKYLPTYCTCVHTRYPYESLQKPLRFALQTVSYAQLKFLSTK